MQWTNPTCLSQPQPKGSSPNSAQRALSLMQTHWVIRGEVRTLAVTSGNRYHFTEPGRCHFSWWVLWLKTGHTGMGKLSGTWPQHPFLCQWVPKLKIRWNTFHSWWSKWAWMCPWIFVLVVGMWIVFSCKVAPFLSAKDHLVPKALAEVCHQATVSKGKQGNWWAI